MVVPFCNITEYYASKIISPCRTTDNSKYKAEIQIPASSFTRPYLFNQHPDTNNFAICIP